MTVFNRKASWLLLFGDVASFVAALWLTLSLRYVERVDRDVFVQHLVPFSVLFIVWVLVFFVWGLYDKGSRSLRWRLPETLMQAQLINAFIAAAFFYLIPWYGISPKTTLFLYLVVSLAIVLLWRVYGYYALAPRSKERAVILAEGEEAKELEREIRANGHYNIDIAGSIDMVQGRESVSRAIIGSGASLVVVDLYNDKVSLLLPTLYNLLMSKVRFMGIDKIYEDVFGRVPLSILSHSWFLENVSTTPKFVYDVFKRIMDVVLSSLLGIVSFLAYPFVYIAIKSDDGGPIFFSQERVGAGGRPIRIAKFRSMSVKDGVDVKNDSVSRVTRVGTFLRKTRIDELPQLWSVFKGDLSLIGPRPEVPALAERYEAVIPYYGMRHVIKPGLSGWAQIYHENHPHHGEAIDETREKLSYDLYYVKNRSLSLDINIALKTIKALLSRKGA